MKTLVVYYSLEGNTKETAEKIAAVMKADLLRLECVNEYPSSGPMKFIKGGKAAVFGEQPALKPYHIDFLSYEAVIVGTPVWASTFAPPLRSFFAHEQITNQKAGFFACEKGSGGEKCLQKLKELTGADRIDAQMILIDPKQNPDPANDEVIRKFCEDMLHA
jgi:flavodoxin